MEKTPKPECEVIPLWVDEKDLVLVALRQQLNEKIIDFDTYKERRQAYLDKLLPDDAA